MSAPTVSIIVPVYKVEKFLRECVDSVLSQTFTDFELILVDDGSPDGCPSICDEYAASDTRVISLHKQNCGLSSARNYGMDRAKGKWIIFLDSDDLWGQPDGLRKLVEYAEYYDLDILRFEYQAIDEEGNKTYPPRPTAKKNIPAGSFSNFEMVDKAIAGEWFAWLYLLRSDVVKNLRYDESCPFQEDIDFYCKLFAVKEYNCGYIAEKFYYYRKREASLTTTFNVKNLMGSFHLCDVFHEQSNLVGEDRLGVLYRYYSVMMYYWTLMTLSENPYYAKRDDIIKNLQLNSLHARTCKRMKGVSIAMKNKLFIYPHPYFGVILMRKKIIFGRYFYKYIQK